MAIRFKKRLGYDRFFFYQENMKEIGKLQDNMKEICKNTWKI